MVPSVDAGFNGHACLVEYLAWACVVGSLCGLECDCGDFADLQGVVMGHAVQKERIVFSVCCFHLVPYGVSVVGPPCADGSGRYGGGPSHVRRPCLGDCTCGWLEGGFGMFQLDWLKAYRGV